jgi:Pro-kumamolisin, activation domain/Bacterial Ig-like domain (group 3)
MLNKIALFILYFAFCFQSPNLFAQQIGRVQTLPRITSQPRDTDVVKLRGQVHQLARPEFDAGSVAPEFPMQRMVLLLRGNDAQEQALDQLLVDLQDENSPQYQHWITPREFGARFGVADEDIVAIQTWLMAHGFAVGPVAKNRLMLEFSGTAAQVSSAFVTEIHQYNIAGVMHVANALDPSIPKAFSGVVLGVLSMDDFRRKSMMQIASRGARAENGISPQYLTASHQNALGPEDFATIYNVGPLWANGIDGTGQTIAVVSRSDLQPYDIENFRQLFNLSPNVPAVIYNGINPGMLNQADVNEVELDAEWAGAVAKNAAVKVIVSASTSTTDGIDLSTLYAVDNNVAPIVSVSYGFCETQTAGVNNYRSLWRQAAAQGISVLVSSGDSGAAGCDDPSETNATRGVAVSGMASSPDVVAVGGTQFNDVSSNAYWTINNNQNNASAISYIPEVAWNESSAKGLWATGGGVSTIYAAPGWQTGAGVPTTDPGTTGHHRYLPDVSLTAGLHDGYVLCVQFGCDSIAGGTSASVTAFAGLIALVNQHTGQFQGNANFHLYPLASVAGVFHDITSGNNSVPCSSCSGGKLTGFSGKAGFDLATGWGSVDANALVTHWNDVSFQPTTITGSASATTFQHGSSVALSATVTGPGTPKGAVAGYVLAGSQTTVLGASDLASGAAQVTTKQIPGGASTLYFRYGGDGVHGSSTSSGISLSVSPEPTSVTVQQPSTIPAWNDFWTLNVAVAGSSGVAVPTGTVDVTVGNNLISTATLDSVGNAVVSSNFSPGAPGSATLSVMYHGDSNFAAGTSSIQMSFAKALPETFLSCGTGTSQDVVLHTDLQCGATVYFNSVSIPSGSVQFLDGNTVVGTIPIAYGTGQFAFHDLALGSHTLNAVYSGDAKYRSSSGSVVYNIVSKGSLLIHQSAAPLAALPGSPVSIWFQIDPQQYGPPLTGTVTLYDAGTAIASYRDSANNAGLTGSFTINTADKPLPKATHNFSVAYSGDPVWGDVSGSVAAVITNPDIVIMPLTPITMKKGETFSTSLQINAVGPNLSGTMSVGCAGAPAEAGCSITPNSVSASSPSAELILTTTAVHQVIGQNSSGIVWRLALLLPFGIVVVGVSNTRRKYATLPVLAIGLVLIACCCGGGRTPTANPAPIPIPAPVPPPGGGGSTITDPGTPTGTYTLTINTTFGSGTAAVTHSYPFQVTIQ